MLASFFFVGTDVSGCSKLILRGLKGASTPRCLEYLSLYIFDDLFTDLSRAELLAEREGPFSVETCVVMLATPRPLLFFRPGMKD